MASMLLKKKPDSSEKTITLPRIYDIQGDGQDVSEENVHLLLSCFRRVKSFILSNFHSVSLATSCVMAIFVGLVIRSWNPEPLPYIVIFSVKLVGIVYQRFLQGMQLPLILAGVVLAVGSIGPSAFSRIQARLYLFQVVSTSLAIIISLMLMVCLEPGSATDLPDKIDQPFSHKILLYIFFDVIRNLFPPNIFESLLYYYDIAFYRPLTNASGLTGFEETIRHYDNPEDSFKDNADVAIFSTSRALPQNWNAGVVLHSGTNFLGVTFAAIVVGLCIDKLGRHKRVIVSLCEDIQIIMMEMIKLVNLVSPLGVFSLLLGDLLELNFVRLQSLATFGFVTVIALLIHGCVTLPFIFMLMTNTNPLHYIINQTHASLAAFCTISELTAYAVNLDCVVNKNLVDSRVASIILTMSAFYNKNGTVIIQCTGTLYVAQVMRVSLTIGQLAMIGVVAVLASTGSEQMVYPEVSLLAVDLHPLSFKIISPAYNSLNAFASACDAYSSAFAAAIIANLSQQDLNEEDRQRNVVE